MLRYIYGHDLPNFPGLQDSMHRDRALQFKTRLRWDVSVDANGWERDEYDGLNPLYVIWEDASGNHGGSMRFLPTSGRHMVSDHFAHLSETRINSPLIWECTRFCLAPTARSSVAGALMLAGGELMRAFALTHLLGVFDARMVRIYNMIGAAPDVLGGAGTGRDLISIGLWSYSPQHRLQVLQRAGIASALSEAWFEQSFGYSIAAAQKAA